MPYLLKPHLVGETCKMLHYVFKMLSFKLLKHKKESSTARIIQNVCTPMNLIGGIGVVAALNSLLNHTYGMQYFDLPKLVFHIRVTKAGRKLYTDVYINRKLHAKSLGGTFKKFLKHHIKVSSKF